MATVQDKTPLILGMPSRDGTGIVDSILTFQRMGPALERPVAFAQGEMGNIPRARNEVLRQVKLNIGEGTYPMLWWDNDIKVPPAQLDAVNAMITYGLTHQVAVTANYRMANGLSVMMGGDRTPGSGAHYTDDELHAMDNWSSVGMTGFGLLFVPAMSTEYEFHSDRYGEDIHFWWDHKELPLVWAKDVNVYHRKSVWL